MRRLLYFTDPMCSWCYAFNIVLEKLKDFFPDLRLELIAGGYSPGENHPITEEQKDFLITTWKSVSLATGAKFNYNLSFADANFCYDSEPPSRALKIIQNFDPDIQFEFLELLQKTFYIENRDITNEEVLAELAEKFGVAQNVFYDAFNSDMIKEETMNGFHFCRRLEVGGFPSIIAQNGENCIAICHGYQSFKYVKEGIEIWLNEFSEE